MDLITIILIFIMGYGVGSIITLNIWLNEVNLKYLEGILTVNYFIGEC